MFFSEVFFSGGVLWNDGLNFDFFFFIMYNSFKFYLYIKHMKTEYLLLVYCEKYHNTLRICRKYNILMT